MISLRTFKEDQQLRLLPRVVQTADNRGQIPAVIGGFQDRIEQLRALVDGFQAFIDPTLDQLRTPNAIVVTFTSDFGKTVRRSMWLTPYFDPAVAILNDPTQDQTVLLPWAESLLGLRAGQVTSVALGFDPKMAPLQSTARLLAKTLGVLDLPDSTPDSTVRLLAATQLQFAMGKGTPRALANRLYALGFQDAIFSPLWTRLAARGNNSLLPKEAELIDAELDLRATPDQLPEDPTYDVTALRDGPFVGWSQTCSLVDSTQAYTLINGDSPFIQVTLLGQTSPNYRGQFSTRETYDLGDVVTLPDNTTYLATTFPPGTPPGGGWTLITEPVTEVVPEDNPIEYTLSGGTPSQEATATLLNANGNDTGIHLAAITTGDAFNGLVVRVSAWSFDNLSTLPLVRSPQRVSMGFYVPGTYRLSYVDGVFSPNSGNIWAVTRQPDSVPGWFITFYAGSLTNPINLPEPPTPTGWTTPQQAKAHARDASIIFEHPGGEIWFQFNDGFDSVYGNNEVPVGLPLPTFKLEDFSAERRSLSVFDRLSKVKFRSSNFDAFAAPATIPVEPIQPNALLQENPNLIPGYVAASPFRPFGGPDSESLIQVDATATQLADDQLTDEESLVNSVIDDWRPATRTPRQSGLALPLLDQFRIAPFDLATVLFVTDGVTLAFSGVASDPLPPKFLSDLDGADVSGIDLATEDLIIFMTEDGITLTTEG